MFASRSDIAPPDTTLLPSWSPGEFVATHDAYEKTLRAMQASDSRIVVVENALSEQQMVAKALAVHSRGRIPFASTFADSWAHARDLLEMAASSRTDIRLAGSHMDVAAGLTRMALEDLAMFRALRGSTVLLASDANQAAALVEAMLDRVGVAYLRTVRMATPVVYAPGERFTIGGSSMLRSSPDDQVTLLGAGVTTHEALAAADLLAADGVRARVIDLYSIKPLDTAAVVAAGLDTGNVVVAEDHWPRGGLGDAVLDALSDATDDISVRHLAVHTRPTAGHPEEQLWRSGIDRTWIATAARDLLEQPRLGPGQRHKRVWALAR
jgi:transketolase